MTWNEFKGAAREMAPRMFRHFGVMPTALIVCGFVERGMGATEDLAWTAFILAVYALGRVAYDRMLRERQDEIDREFAASIVREMSEGVAPTREEFDAWYRAVRIVNLARVEVPRG